ncbi:MAG: S1 RNA-binding domain-containing protein, partial [Alphaproteobacteria bacterium]|nr:S1 RNA-binding domain-containing protein [Alphaproteobacteria bacterium]
RPRISLCLKQCTTNPWTDFVESHQIGSIVEGEVKNITEFGMFIGLNGDIDGMVHLSDLDWARSGEEALTDYKKGDAVKAKVLEIDIEKERVSLGIKQLTEDPYHAGASEMKKGSRVTCTVTAVQDKGIEVLVGDQITAFMRKGDLSRDRSEQRPDRFAPGDKVDALVTAFDAKSRKLSVSIKALEVREEKQAMAQYGSSDSGASLGDILGAAIHKKSAENAEEGEEKKKPEKKATAKKTDKKTAKKASEKTDAAEDTNTEEEQP